MNAQPENPFDIKIDTEDQLNANEPQNNLTEDETLFEEIDDNEEDGQLFWVIQKTIWSIVKSLLFLLIIGGSIWIIWGNGKNISLPKISLPKIFNSSNIDNPRSKIAKSTSEKNQSKTQLEEKIETKTETEISNIKQKISAEKNPSALLVRWSFWMHRTQTAVAQNEIEKTLKWQLSIQNYLGNDILNLIEAPTLFERTQKVSDFEKQLETFQLQGKNLQNVLLVEHRIADKKLQIQTEKLNSITQNLDSKLASKNYFGFENLLQQKYETAGKIEQFTTETNIRKYLLNDIQKYQTYLDDIENKLIANKAAILSDIKVKPFTNDPFKRLEP